MSKTFFAHSVLQCAEAPDGTSDMQVPDSASIKSEAGTYKWVGYIHTNIPWTIAIQLPWSSIQEWSQAYFEN